jgi:hypothetical protein
VFQCNCFAKTVFPYLDQIVLWFGLSHQSLEKAALLLFSLLHLLLPVNAFLLLQLLSLQLV